MSNSERKLQNFDLWQAFKRGLKSKEGDEEIGLVEHARSLVGAVNRGMGRAPTEEAAVTDAASSRSTGAAAPAPKTSRKERKAQKRAEEALDPLTAQLHPSVRRFQDMILDDPELPRDLPDMVGSFAMLDLLFTDNADHEDKPLWRGLGFDINNITRILQALYGKLNTHITPGALTRKITSKIKGLDGNRRDKHFLEVFYYDYLGLKNDSTEETMCERLQDFIREANPLDEIFAFSQYDRVINAVDLRIQGEHIDNIFDHQDVHMTRYDTTAYGYQPPHVFEEESGDLQRILDDIAERAGLSRVNPAAPASSTTAPGAIDDMKAFAGEFSTETETAHSHGVLIKLEEVFKGYADPDNQAKLAALLSILDDPALGSFVVDGATQGFGTQLMLAFADPGQSMDLLAMFEFIAKGFEINDQEKLKQKLIDIADACESAL